MVVALLSVHPDKMRQSSKPRWMQRQLGMLVARRLLTSLTTMLLPITDVEQSAHIEVELTLAPSRAKNSRKRKAKATDNVGVTRTTRSKASKNDRKSRNI
jgi:hypothetical protein